jgi:hypothetical protein
MAENDFNLKNSSEYLHLSFDETFNVLKSSKSGLSEEEAERRINLFGKNDVLEKKENLLKLFFRLFLGSDGVVYGVSYHIDGFYKSLS